MIAEGGQTCWRGGRAEGNPFFAGELLRTLEEKQALLLRATGWALGDLGEVGVPPLLRQVIDARVDRLGEPPRTLLPVAAVIGPLVPLAVWQVVAETDEATLLAVVEGAEVAGLVVETPDGAQVRFAHALIREALYEGVIPARRRVWHRRIAEALLGQPDPDPNAVAYHLRAAGDARASEWLVRAGERARRAYAWFTAAERFEAALALLEEHSTAGSERGWLLYRLAVVRRYSDPHRSLACFDEARQLAERGGEQSLAAYALFEHGMVRCFTGEIEHGMREMAVGADALEALPPTEQARVTALLAGLDDPPGFLRGTLVFWLAYTGAVVEARQMGEAMLARVPTYQPVKGAGGSSFADAHFGLMIAYAAPGQPAATRQMFARARNLYQAVDHFYLLGNLTHLALHWVTLPYAADNLRERQRLAAEAEQHYRRASGAALAAFPADFAWLPLLLLEGRWAEARALAEAARGTDAEVWIFALPAWLAHKQGNPALAWQLLRDWLPDREEIPVGAFAQFISLTQRLAATLALDTSDLSTARAWLVAHDRWLAWSGAVLWQAEGQLGWAAYYRAAGDRAAARAYADQALALATKPRQPLALLAVYHLLGELATADRNQAEAQAHLTEALVLADACAVPYERALCLLAQAELRATTGDRDGARMVLAEARGILDPLGAKPALARADALAARLAATPPTGQVTYPAGLSAREVEVLRLVAQGLSDAQVAERLFLSPRTVSTHLRAIYNKLGVDNRTAARFAAAHGLSRE
jgi:DNA-binding CsgD family transcriptional regulator